jgi:hypothetical protein
VPRRGGWRQGVRVGLLIYFYFSVGVALSVWFRLRENGSFLPAAILWAMTFGLLVAWPAFLVLWLWSGVGP